MPTRPTLPTQLLQLRQRQGLTQSDLAKRAGMPAAAISHFERGYRVPGTRTLTRLAEALGVSTDELLGLSREPAPSDGAMRALFRNARELTPGALAELESFSKFLRSREKVSGNESEG